MQCKTRASCDRQEHTLLVLNEPPFIQTADNRDTQRSPPTVNWQSQTYPNKHAQYTKVTTIKLENNVKNCDHFHSTTII